MRNRLLVDDLYQEAAPDWVRFWPGSDRMRMSDSEIICLSVMQEGRSNDSELSFHRLVAKDERHLFFDLVDRSRDHRRRKALMGVQREMLRLLMVRLLMVRVLMVRVRPLAAWLLIDSAPIATAELPRWKTARMSVWT